MCNYRPEVSLDFCDHLFYPVEVLTCIAAGGGSTGRRPWIGLNTRSDEEYLDYAGEGKLQLDMNRLSSCAKESEVCVERLVGRDIWMETVLQNVDHAQGSERPEQSQNKNQKKILPHLQKERSKNGQKI